MKLYIAEKPSLGRAIAEALPKPHRREEGCIRVGNGDVVSWCVGHLLEQCEPEAYKAEYKQWKMQHLPIIPQQWQLQAKAKTRKQLTVLRNLVKQATQLVHAGDPDREGQLLVDQLIDYLKVDTAKRHATQRCLISDLTPTAVAKSLAQLRQNSEFKSLSISALARSRADWLYGINMTRAYTLQGQKVGFQGLLSVGRVQTPVLGLVVKRDSEIENFQSKAYFEVLAHLTTTKQESFTAKWVPSDACQAFIDEEGRVLSRALAENVQRRIEGKPGTVQAVERQAKSQVAPLPYNLSSLQIDAAKCFSFSAKQVLDICQTLYEKYQLITYPRSDCRFLPREHYAQATSVLKALAANTPSLAAAVKQADPRLKGRAWNDSKVGAHHAIIPTRKILSSQPLSAQEAKVYTLIARQYLLQFYPKWEYCDTKIEVIIEGGLFVAKARTTKKLGWKALFEKTTAKPANTQTSDNDSDAPIPVLQLPEVAVGESLKCCRAELLEKATQAPKHFTDASLLAAMTGIARFVSSPEIKKVLKETDGLGTEATRAGILELLFTRNYLMRKGKQIHATAAGRALIASLPSSATAPDLTAQWEVALNAIGQGCSGYKAFMQPLEQTLQNLIQQCQSTSLTALRGVTVGKQPSAKRKRKPRKAPKKSAQTG
ncbi:MAG: DNA topoisomerase III [Cellvibrionaceae bacterium]|nr:DNA topoisomerase III [Cellvibrionaceae bacterium]